MHEEIVARAGRIGENIQYNMRGEEGKRTEEGGCHDIFVAAREGECTRECSRKGVSAREGERARKLLHEQGDSAQEGERARKLLHEQGEGTYNTICVAGGKENGRGGVSKRRSMMCM